jgi:predicted nucleic acid-binding protein
VKTLFDTSLLVQALQRSLPHHAKAKTWLDRALGGEFEFLVASHTLAELYAILTALPVSPRIAPGEARRLIRDNVENAAEVISLAAKDYREILNDLSDRGLIGGIVYDALICKAAQKASIQRLVTFNRDHFVRVWPEGADIIQMA